MDQKTTCCSGTIKSIRTSKITRAANHESEKSEGLYRNRHAIKIIHKYNFFPRLDHGLDQGQPRT